MSFTFFQIDVFQTFKNEETSRVEDELMMCYVGFDSAGGLVRIWDLGFGIWDLGFKSRNGFSV